MNHKGTACTLHDSTTRVASTTQTESFAFTQYFAFCCYGPEVRNLKRRKTRDMVNYLQSYGQLPTDPAKRGKRVNLVNYLHSPVNSGMGQDSREIENQPI